MKIPRVAFVIRTFEESLFVFDFVPKSSSSSWRLSACIYVFWLPIAVRTDEMAAQSFEQRNYSYFNHS